MLTAHFPIGVTQSSSSRFLYQEFAMVLKFTQGLVSLKNMQNGIIYT